jgi:hypothetical protein
MKADRLTYRKMYSDGSDVEFEVAYINEPYLHDKKIQGFVKIEHVDDLVIPITKLNWLIECLSRIKQNLDD